METQAGHLPYECHHLKLHIHAVDGEIGKAETQAEVWVLSGGRECPLLSQSSHPVHTVFHRARPHSMASAGKGLAESVDKQHKLVCPPSLRGRDITGLQQGRLQTLLQKD